MHQNVLTSVAYVQQHSSTTAPSHGTLEYTRVRCKLDSSIFVFSLVIFKYLLSVTSLLSGEKKKKKKKDIWKVELKTVLLCMLH